VRPPRLEFDHVGVTRGDRVVFADCDATVPADGVTAVFGPSGCGKSTLLRLCNRLGVPDAGRVLLDGVDVASIEPTSLRRRVGMVFQQPTPFGGTVADNLRVAEPTLDDAAAAALLARCGLDGSFLTRPAPELSGGEAQRMCLARTLATEPEVLLADEPTAALDAVATAAIESTVAALADDGMTVVWVGHDAAQVRRVADRVLFVSDGRLRAGGVDDTVLDLRDGEHT
jgi:putative ABC transport system ATP-binding protein